MSNTVVLRSIINQYFTEDVFVDLYKVTLAYKLNNNQRGLLVKEIMKKYNIPASPLGNGTNRIGLLVDGYAVKIALDDDGMIAFQVNQRVNIIEFTEHCLVKTKYGYIKISKEYLKIL